MRYVSILLLLIFFSFSLSACAQKTTPHKAKVKKVDKRVAVSQTATPIKTPAGPVLTFERTACNGLCPAYSMQVFADGRVAYEGKRAVPLLGPQEFKLTPAALADILRQAEEAHFNQFLDQYSRGTSDLPSTVIAIRQPNGKLKAVVMEEGEPENVRALFTRLGKQFDALAQLSGVEK